MGYQLCLISVGLYKNKGCLPEFNLQPLPQLMNAVKCHVGLYLKGGFYHRLYRILWSVARHRNYQWISQLSQPTGNTNTKYWSFDTLDKYVLNCFIMKHRQKQQHHYISFHRTEPVSCPLLEYLERHSRNRTGVTNTGNEVNNIRG